MIMYISTVLNIVLLVLLNYQKWSATDILELEAMA